MGLESTGNTGLPSLWTTWAISIANGFWGDYLQARDNGLAVDMGFYHHGQKLPLDRHSLATAQPRAGARVCILVHGLACNEYMWTFPSSLQAGGAAASPTDYGRLLQAELGFTPYYLRYNTGLSVAANGRSLSGLLEQLSASHPVPIAEVLMIAHSMGGLVVRSACHYAMQHDALWVQAVKNVFYLGTPHDGADLARLAHATVSVLNAVRNPITHLISDFIDTRSQGIKDLRHGTLIEPDVFDEGWEDASHHHQRAVPWLPHAQHYLVAGSVTRDANHIASVILGDGLVSAPANAANAVPDANIRLFPGIPHLQLARHPDVYQQIKTWRQQAGERE